MSAGQQHARESTRNIKRHGFLHDFSFDVLSGAVEPVSSFPLDAPAEDPPPIPALARELKATRNHEKRHSITAGTDMLQIEAGPFVDVGLQDGTTVVVGGVSRVLAKIITARVQDVTIYYLATYTDPGAKA